MPPRPELPLLTPEQEQRIPDDIYQVLVKRDETLLQYIERLIGVIDTHNRGVSDADQSTP